MLTFLVRTLGINMRLLIDSSSDGHHCEHCHTCFTSQEFLDHHLSPSSGGSRDCQNTTRATTRKPFQCGEEGCGEGYMLQKQFDHHVRDVHHSLNLKFFAFSMVVFTQAVFLLL